MNFKPNYSQFIIVLKDIIRLCEEVVSGVGSSRRAMDVTLAMILSKLKQVQRMIADAASYLSLMLNFTDLLMQPGLVDMFDQLNNRLEHSKIDSYFDNNFLKLKFWPSQLVLQLDRFFAGLVEFCNQSANMFATERCCAPHLLLTVVQAHLRMFYKTLTYIDEKTVSNDMIEAKFHDLIPSCAKSNSYVLNLLCMARNSGGIASTEKCRLVPGRLLPIELDRDLKIEYPLHVFTNFFRNMWRDSVQNGIVITPSP